MWQSLGVLGVAWGGLLPTVGGKDRRARGRVRVRRLLLESNGGQVRAKGVGRGGQ